MSNYPLPEKTGEALNNQQSKCAHAGLVLERYISYRNRSTWEPEVDSRKKINEKIEIRKAAEEALVFLNEGYFSALKERQNRIRQSYKDTGWAVTEPPITLQLAERMIIGLGAASVLETSITLHRNYGIPIIPGSAAKGIARAAAFWSLADYFMIHSLEGAAREACDKQPLELLDSLLAAGEKSEQQESFRKLKVQIKKLNEDNSIKESIDKNFGKKMLDGTANSFSDESPVIEFRETFGTTANGGRVVFLDAIPQGKPRLEIDIMNPHYGAYYKTEKRPDPSNPQKKIAVPTEPPADYLSPVPIYFLTVAAGSQFEFTLMAQKFRPDKHTFKNEYLLDKAKSWLRDGLTGLGIGAKTSSGYGYMDIIGS